MIKRSSVELTALLDIILILLFAFMLNFNTDYQSVQDEKEVLVQETEELRDQVRELQAQVDQFSQNQFRQEQEKETLTTLAQGIGNFLAEHQGELEALIEEADVRNQQALVENLNKLIDEKQMVKELWKHETLVKQFYFVEVGLKSGYNEVHINQSSTKITIAFEELDTYLKREKKKEEIKDAIESFIKDREGGIGLMALSLTLMDQEVYQYAYELTWEAIKEIQEKYGTDKIFITEYTLF